MDRCLLPHWRFCCLNCSGRRSQGTPPAVRLEYSLSPVCPARRPEFTARKRRFDEVVPQFKRRLLGLANKNMQNLADPKRGFRINSRHRITVLTTMQGWIGTKTGMTESKGSSPVVPGASLESRGEKAFRAVDLLWTALNRRSDICGNKFTGKMGDGRKELAAGNVFA